MVRDKFILLIVIFIFIDLGFDGHPMRKDFPLTVRTFVSISLKYWLILLFLGLHGSPLRRRAEARGIRTFATHPGIPVSVSSYLY